jgi:putative CocE/NonD family hydrolase
VNKRTACMFLCLSIGLASTLTRAHSLARLPSQEASRTSAAELLFKTITEEGVETAVKKYREIQGGPHDTYYFDEMEVNRVGLRLLREMHKPEEAIAVFKLNVENYPKSANTWDSLAYGYMRNNELEKAEKYFAKALEIYKELPDLNRAYARDAENVPTFLQQIQIRRLYTRQELMVPMRDGIELYTQVYIPKDQKRKYPILLFRTPYSIGSYGPEAYRSVLGPNRLYAQDGFIFVYQDVRGKFRSKGEFIVMKPHKREKQGPQDTDESSDTFDTIEWIIQNVPNHNGRVGQWGISYPGWQTVMGMVDAHPALKASSPQASPADMWIGDDFHHNGAFRLMYTFGWLSNNARIRSGTTSERSRRFRFDTPDGYNFFLALGSVANVNRRYFDNSVPTWNEYMEHGDYDEYWKEQNVLQYLENIRHPILNVAGWFDAEDFYGPMSIYYTIEKKNPGNRSTLVVGPWLHGGWARMDGDVLGDIRFETKTSEYFREKVEFPFFLYHLKDMGALDLPEALVFETGSNQWKSYDSWPPKEAEQKELYFRAHGGLSLSPPPENSNEGLDSFLSDPQKPVPWSTEIRTNQGHLWMIEDQRFASRRPDVLVYQTEALTEDLTITGPITADLFFSTTGTDADWIVKLIDVYPGNAPNNSPNPGVRMGDYQMLLAGEVFRSKYRNSFERPEPLEPGSVTEISFDLHDKCHTFRKGHRIMVQVQSTWFPVIDRNPQIFTDIYQAREEDFTKSTHLVFRSKDYPSHLKVRILKTDAITSASR